MSKRLYYACKTDHTLALIDIHKKPFMDIPLEKTNHTFPSRQHYHMWIPLSIADNLNLLYDMSDITGEARIELCYELDYSIWCAGIDNDLKKLYSLIQTNSDAILQLQSTLIDINTKIGEQHD